MYTVGMTRRTTIEIDEALLGRAQVALGTRGLKDTVEAALHAVVRRQGRDRLAARIVSGDGVDRSAAALDEVRPRR